MSNFNKKDLSLAEQISWYENDVLQREKEKEKVGTEIIWIESFDIENNNRLIESSTVAIEQAEKLLRKLNNEIKYTEQSIEKEKKKFWFFETQKFKDLNKHLELKKVEYDETGKHKKKEITKLSLLLSKKERFNRRSVHYESFQKILTEIEKCRIELGKLNEVYLSDKDLYDELNKTIHAINLLEKNNEGLLDLQNDLGKDGNSPYDRAMIHKKCEEIYGHGKPSVVLRDNKKKLRIANENCHKIRKQIEVNKEKRKYKDTIRDEGDSKTKSFKKKINSNIESFPPKKIVVDGSNLCFESGKEFISANALAYLTHRLQQSYETIVIFDFKSFNNLGLQKADKNDLDKLFGDKVKVHQVQQDRKADETILEYANYDEQCYIISNDRFREYSEEECVKNNRILRHEIVAGKIIIHDLDITLSYQ